MAKGQQQTNDTQPGASGNDQPQPPQPNYPRKLTLKECGAQPSKEDRAKLLLDAKLQIPLLRIFGIAGAFKPGNSDHGPFVKFIGQFKAINLKTGEIFVASTMILPRFIEEQLHGVLSAAASQSVEFAFEISAQGDQPGAKASATGYTYSAKPLMGFAENSALAALEAKIGGSNVAQLKGPGKQPG